MSLTRTKVTCAAAAGAAAAKRMPLIGTSSRPVATRRVISMGSIPAECGCVLSAFPARAELKVPSLRTPSCPLSFRARDIHRCHSGARAKRASPESIIRSGGYGFRAPSLRSGPGMTAERDARNGAPYHRRHSGARLQGASPESIIPSGGDGLPRCARVPVLGSFRDLHESFLNELRRSRHGIRVDLDSGKQVRVSPFVSFRGRAT